MITPTNEVVGHLQDDHSASARLRVLILEDNQRDAELFVQKLKEAGFALDAETVDTEEAFVASFRSRVYDLILSDYSVPKWSGLEAFRFVKRSGINIPFVLVTGTLGEEAAVDLIKEGVADYILKDRLARLPSAVRRALEEKLTRDEAVRAALRKRAARRNRIVDIQRVRDWKCSLSLFTRRRRARLFRPLNVS